MTNRATFLLAPLLLACAALPGLAVADDAAESAVARLARAGSLACRPELPHFCDNVHVRCVGFTKVPTFAFTLRATPQKGSLEPAEGAEDFRQRYEGAQIEWDRNGEYVLLQPTGSNGYVKLFADGRYVFRHYEQAKGVMSLGQCR